MELGITIFVSYKHDKDDEKILKELCEFIRPTLSTLGVNIWTDTQILPGYFWDKEIKSKLNSADIALTLVSQKYLGSRYIQEEEIATFIRRRVDEGLVIFPIILSPCTWENHDWLRETQSLPRNGKTIEQDYIHSGKRKALYKEITDDLMIIVKETQGLYARLKSENHKIYCGNCGKSNQVDQISSLCKYCGSTLQTPFRLKTDNDEIFINYDTILYPYHFDIRKYKITSPIGSVAKHPTHPDVWGLKNTSEKDWKRISSNGKSRLVLPGATLLLETGIKIIFGDGMKGAII